MSWSREEGPDHAKQFDAVVYLRGVAHGVGQGRSKKLAEQAAARQAWARLGDEDAVLGSGGPDAGDVVTAAPPA